MKSGRQAGLSTVEFAIVAVVLLTVIIAVIDISRLFFSAAALNEGTRRGARMAAVCPVNDPAIAQAAVFGASADGGSAPFVAGLQAEHIDVLYLDASGTLIPNPEGDFLKIRYVRVAINGGFQMETFIPGFSEVFSVPDYAATLPRESLGVPREGEVVSC